MVDHQKLIYRTWFGICRPGRKKSKLVRLRFSPCHKIPCQQISTNLVGSVKFLKNGRGVEKSGGSKKWWGGRNLSGSVEFQKNGRGVVKIVKKWSGDPKKLSKKLRNLTQNLIENLTFFCEISCFLTSKKWSFFWVFFRPTFWKNRKNRKSVVINANFRVFSNFLKKSLFVCQKNQKNLLQKNRKSRSFFRIVKGFGKIEKWVDIYYICGKIPEILRFFCIARNLVLANCQICHRNGSGWPFFSKKSVFWPPKWPQMGQVLDLP